MGALDEPSPTKEPKASGWGGTAQRTLKALGAASALLALGAGLYPLGHFFYVTEHEHHHVKELLAIAQGQQDRKEFQDAWNTLIEAIKVEEANTFAGDEQTLRRLQEDLAMIWLEDSHLGEEQSFTQFVAMLEPTVERGLARAEPRRQADLRAHLGWAAFLRSREASTDRFRPDQEYKRAIDLDAENPYANAMLGHWIMWTTGDLMAARPLFATAVASRRAQEYVRLLQLAALDNADTAAANLEEIRAANDMRKLNQIPAEKERSEIWRVYYSFSTHDDGDYAFKNILAVISPEDHLLTLRWLYDEAHFDDGNRILLTCYTGFLQDAAGQHEKALETFNSVWPQLVDFSPAIKHRVAAAMKRLSTKYDPRKRSESRF